MAGHDTEKCIKKALEDGVIEPEYKSDWRRDHDVYRLMPKGLKQSDKHMMDAFERSARIAGLDYEEDVRKEARAAGAAAAGPGRPPLAAGELIRQSANSRGAAAGGTAQRLGCGAPLGPAACNRALCRILDGAHCAPALSFELRTLHLNMASRHHRAETS